MGQEHSSEFFLSVTDMIEDIGDISASVVQLDVLWEICIAIEYHLDFDEILEQDPLVQWLLIMAALIRDSKDTWGSNFWWWKCNKDTYGPLLNCNTCGICRRSIYMKQMSLHRCNDVFFTRLLAAPWLLRFSLHK